MSGGSWSAYWYNGLIMSSEIARGLDVYELLPSPLLSANEIAAAKTVKMPYWNVQEQQKIVWPPTFALARAYLDQLERSKGLAAAAIDDARTALTAAERRSGAQRKTALTALATKLNGAAAAAQGTGEGAPAVGRRHRPGQRDALNGLSRDERITTGNRDSARPHGRAESAGCPDASGRPDPSGGNAPGTADPRSEHAGIRHGEGAA